MSKDEIAKKLKRYQPRLVGNKIIIYSMDEGSAVLKRVADMLPDSIYVPPAEDTSSFGEVREGKFKIIVQKKIDSNGAASAGTQATDIAESAQCFYCAAAWYGSDYSYDTLRQHSKYVNTTGNLRSIKQFLSDEWIQSCISTADRLKSYCGTNRYTFHRGSSFTTAIKDNYLAINRRFPEFSNVNKWNPSDIYLVADTLKKPRWDFADFNQINEFLYEHLKSKELIGVSLKKTGKPAALTEVNLDKPQYDTTYKGLSTGKKGFFTTNVVYIFYDDGSIEFRTFPTWQGEIQGKFHNHGKISNGPINNIISKYTRHRIDPQSQVEAKIRTKQASFYRDFHELYLKIEKTKLSYDQFMANLDGKDDKFLISKYLGSQLVWAMQNASYESKQMIVSSMINYAKSQSDFSAPYVKVY